MRALAALAALAILAPLALAEPTPGVNASLARIVPEPHETNDYVSYAEWRAMLDRIAQEYPDFVEVIEVAQSFGWENLQGGHDTFPILAVEVTNENSARPRGEKPVAYFQLSIHGNEKGGREGGFRVIEDLAAPLGWGADYRAMLDDFLVVFVFPNADGWVHEEPQYRHNCANYFAIDLPTGQCAETQSFVRFNGNLQDMNRDWPTVGWYNTGGGREQGFSEPEMAGIGNYTRQFQGRTRAAVDIHGMLNPADGGINNPLPAGDPLGLTSPGAGPRSSCLPENPAGVECPVTEGHFVLGLMAGGGDADLAHRIQRLGDRTKDYVNAMAAERFPYWTSSPNVGLAGGEFFEWGTGWETIGYTDSGSTGRWIPEGLGAPGGSLEMSYNHITFDNHYVEEINAMHVESVRAIVRAHLDEARELPRLSLMWEGTVGVLHDDRAVQGDSAALEGPHANSTLDDAYEGAFAAQPSRFWDDLAAYGPAGGLARVAPADLAAGRLPPLEALVIPGYAADLATEAAWAQAKAFAERGGRLLLLDDALQGLEAMGLAEAGSVASGEAYLGHVNVVRDHPLAAETRALAKQTYDGVSLGFEPGTNPVWTVAAGAFEGEVAGTTFAEDQASFGRLAVGEGEVVFLGALLPRPTAEGYTPYKVGNHAVTYHGYRLLYNSLGIALEETAAALDGGAGQAPQQAPQRTPGAEGAGLLAVLAGLGLAARRRAPKA